VALRESQCQMWGAHQCEVEDKAKGRAMRKWVHQDREQCHELCEMRGCCKASHTCVGFCWSGGGVLKDAVEHKLGCSAEAAQDMGKGMEQSMGGVRKDKGKCDWPLV